MTQFTWFLIDAAVVIATLVTIFLFGKKGLCKHFSKLVVFVIAIICAVKISAFLVDGVYTKIEPKINGFIGEKICELAENIDEKELVDTSSIDDKLDAVSEKTGQKIEIDWSSIINLKEKAAQGTDAVIDVVTPIIKVVVRWILAVIIFFIVKLVGNLLTEPVSKLIKKLPVIGWIDHGLGGLLGLCIALIVIFAVIKIGNLCGIKFIEDYVNASKLAAYIWSK